MGHYTEYNFRFQLDRDNEELIAFVKDWLSGASVQRSSEHEFFSMTRWSNMPFAISGSFPFVVGQSGFFEDQYVFNVRIAGSIKNEDNVVEKFIDWLKPHVEDQGFIGYTMEENSMSEGVTSPTLHFA